LAWRVKSDKKLLRDEGFWDSGDSPGEGCKVRKQWELGETKEGQYGWAVVLGTRNEGEAASRVDGYRGWIVF
jgi:hypothetical protein